MDIWIAWIVKRLPVADINIVGQAHAHNEQWRTLCGKKMGSWTRWEYGLATSIDEVTCKTCRRRLEKQQPADI